MSAAKHKKIILLITAALIVCLALMPAAGAPDIPADTGSRSFVKNITSSAALPAANAGSAADAKYTPGPALFSAAALYFLPASAAAAIYVRQSGSLMFYRPEDATSLPSGDPAPPKAL